MLADVLDGVIHVGLRMSVSLPLIPRKRAYSGRRGISHLCQLEKSGADLSLCPGAGRHSMKMDITLESQIVADVACRSRGTRYQTVPFLVSARSTRMDL